MHIGKQRRQQQQGPSYSCEQSRTQDEMPEPFSIGGCRSMPNRSAVEKFLNIIVVATLIIGVGGTPASTNITKNTHCHVIESKPGQKYIVRIKSQLNSAEPVNSGPSEEAERQVTQTAAKGLWLCSTAALFAIIVYMRRRWEGEGKIEETKKQKKIKMLPKVQQFYGDR